MQRFGAHMRIRPLVVAIENPQEDKEDDEKREWYRKKLMDEYEKDVLSGKFGAQTPSEGTKWLCIYTPKRLRSASAPDTVLIAWGEGGSNETDNSGFA